MAQDTKLHSNHRNKFKCNNSGKPGVYECKPLNIPKLEQPKFFSSRKQDCDYEHKFVNMIKTMSKTLMAKLEDIKIPQTKFLTATISHAKLQGLSNLNLDDTCIDTTDPKTWIFYSNVKVPFVQLKSRIR